MEGGEEGAEILWEKVRRVGKRGGHSTPAASFWRTNELGLSANVSSRKLAAALWELHHYKPPLDNTRRRVDQLDVGGAEPLHPPPTSFQLPESSSYLRRRVAESRMQHHRSIGTSNHATQTASPSSCSSSMEIAPCYPATSSSSIELKGRKGELTYSVRTSSELLKVLNRVWSLEEQHVSNMSLIKALKKELDRARFHAKELAREQQGGGQHGMDKLLRRNNEQERVKAKAQSTRDELEYERRLRKQSESLERELAQELYKVKNSLASISKELEEERVSRRFLEDLCDELAWGVRDCEKELPDGRQKPDKDLGEREDHDHDWFLLRISQAWLEERMQVKQQHRNPRYQKSSLESIPLNLGASARREEADDDGSSSSRSSCFEAEKTGECSLKPQGQKNHLEEMMKEKLESCDGTRAMNPSRLQAKFEEHMAQAMSYAISKIQVKDGQGNPGEIGISQKAEAEREAEGISELDSNDAINTLIRYYHFFSENEMQSNKYHVMASPLGRRLQSPGREWTKKLAARDLDTPEAPLESLSELKESASREKLVEVRSRGQKSRSRQKSLIHPSRDE